MNSDRHLPTIGISVALALVLVLALAVGAPAPAQARPVTAPAADGTITPIDQPGIDRLIADTGGATVDVSPATGAVRFVSLTPAQVERLAQVLGASGRAEGQATAFFARYGSIFGLNVPATELRLLSTETDQFGYTHLTYQQVYRDLPVFAAIMRVHLDAAMRITAVNGTFIPGLAVDPAPRLSAADAEAIAVAQVVGGSNASTALAVQRTTLYVYRADLAKSVPGLNHLAYEVEVGNNQDVREFVYVDAHKGDVVNRVTGIYDTIHRHLYDTTYGNLVWQEGDAFPTGNTEWDNVLSATKDTYDLIDHASGGTYLSYNGSDAVMEGLANSPMGGACPNASWNGTYAQFCTGVSGDDTVAHEWGHAYNEYNANLIYQWQPGALSESNSDIIGEVADMVNGPNLPDVHRTDGGCSVYTTPPGTDNSYRWLSGEDDTASGVIRDLWNPTCLGDPGKVTDTQYVCSSGDGGGVHTNCGVPNHAYALITDGGTYNGQVVAGIGMTKTFAIHWRAMDLYMVPTTDFEDYANALDQSCTDLIGVNLPSLYTGAPSGISITAGDCAELAKAELAVQLRTWPTQCNFQPLLNPNTPAWCSTAGEGPVVIWRDTLESDPTTTWTLSNTGVYTTYTPRDWEWDHTLPDGRAGSAFFGIDSLTIGDCDPTSNDQSGVMHADSPVFTIPAGVTAPVLAFDHYVATEYRWDGGNVKYSVNGGAWTLVPRTTFTFNQYNITLQTAGAGNTNPLAGQYAFTGSDGGEPSGSWGQSRVNLGTLVTPGQTMQLRLDLGVDGCNGLDGWYVDNVVVYYCSATPTAVDVSAVTSSTPYGSIGLVALLALGAVIALALARKR